MAHEAEPVEQDEDDPNAFDTFYIGLIGTFLVVAGVAFFSGVYFWVEKNNEEQAAIIAYEPLVQLQEEQRANLNRSGSVTRPDGERKKALPIEQAMKKVAQDLAPKR